MRVAAAVPLGNSRIECAHRLAAIRHFGTSLRILITRRFLSKNTISMGNFMPMVCTASQGVIQSPSPFSSLVCFSSPILRVRLVSAMSARSANTVDLD